MYAQKSEIEPRFAALSAEDSAFLREVKKTEDRFSHEDDTATHDQSYDQSHHNDLF